MVTAAASAEAKGIYTANRAVHRAFVEHCGKRKASLLG